MKLERQFRRLYSIPDIHGRSDLLDLALEKMDEHGYDPKQDLLVVVGDMIDRGPDSMGVLDILISLQSADPETVVVLRGNHEDFAVDTYVTHRSGAKEAWYWNGGADTERSYPNGYMSEEHVRWLAGLPYSVEAQGFYFSHAPVPREKSRKGVTSDYGYVGKNYGSKGNEYTVWERTWYYFGIEGEKPGALMDVHEGPLSDNGLGTDHLIGICGHIHRGASATEVRIFPRYRMIDCGSGCFGTSPLAVHECLSNQTFYAKPQDLDKDEP